LNQVAFSQQKPKLAGIKLPALDHIAHMMNAFIHKNPFDKLQNARSCLHNDECSQGGKSWFCYRSEHGQRCAPCFYCARDQSSADGACPSQCVIERLRKQAEKEHFVNTPLWEEPTTEFLENKKQLKVPCNFHTQCASSEFCYKLRGQGHNFKNAPPDAAPSANDPLPRPPLPFPPRRLEMAQAHCLACHYCESDSEAVDGKCPNQCITLREAWERKQWIAAEKRMTQMLGTINKEKQQLAEDKQNIKQEGLVVKKMLEQEHSAQEALDRTQTRVREEEKRVHEAEVELEKETSELRLHSTTQEKQQNELDKLNEQEAKLNDKAIFLRQQELALQDEIHFIVIVSSSVAAIFFGLLIFATIYRGKIRQAMARDVVAYSTVLSSEIEMAENDRTLGISAASNRVGEEEGGDLEDREERELQQELNQAMGHK